MTKKELKKTRYSLLLQRKSIEKHRRRKEKLVFHEGESLIEATQNSSNSSLGEEIKYLHTFSEDQIELDFQDSFVQKLNEKFSLINQNDPNLYFVIASDAIGNRIVCLRLHSVQRTKI